MSSSTFIERCWTSVNDLTTTTTTAKTNQRTNFDEKSFLQSTNLRASSSRVQQIISQFECQTIDEENKRNSCSMTLPIENLFLHQFEEKKVNGSTSTSTIYFFEKSSRLTTTTKSNQYEEKCFRSTSNLSVESTNCSTPRFARPTISSTQKQKHFHPSTINAFQRSSSSASLTPISTFTRIVHSNRLTSIDEEQQQQHQQRGGRAREDLSVEENFSSNFNRNLPLRYKRDSLIRLYG